MTDRYEHGTWRRYRYDGCHCDGCRAAWSTYVQLRKLDKMRGRQRLVDATPAVEHVQHLVDEWGVAKHRVWEAGGCSRTMGHYLMTGRNHRADRAVVDDVCAVTIHDLPDDCWMSVDRVHDLVAEVRRVRGWSYRELSSRAGFVESYLIDMRRHHAKRVRVGVWRTLRRFVDDRDLQAVVCQDCGGPSWAGGLRCRDCYAAAATPSAFRWNGCGSDAGYTRHRRAGETPCDACRAAHAQAHSVREGAA